MLNDQICGNEHLPYVDLHTHTTSSDGTTEPEENVRLAAEKGLAAVAITDHDTIGGISAALQAGEQYNIEVVPGIEISTLAGGQDIHVLGYYISYQDSELEQELSKLRNTRNLRNQMLIEKLNQLDIPITMAEVRARQQTPGGNVGRPHIAEVLIEKGYADSLEDAFEKYLGREGKAYVNPPRITPHEAVQLIIRFGGIPVLAHPGLYDMDQLIPELVEAGLRGIEVYHPDHSDEEKMHYAKLAQRYNMLVTGGSDFHGWRAGKVFHSELGSQPATVDMLKQLRDIAQK